MSRQDQASENIAVVNAHFENEEAGRMGAVLDLYTDDVIWEAPSRGVTLKGKGAAADNYDAECFSSVVDLKSRSLSRFAADGRVVDDSVLSFKLAEDSFPMLRCPLAPRWSCGRFTYSKCAAGRSRVKPFTAELADHEREARGSAGHRLGVKARAIPGGDRSARIGLLGIKSGFERGRARCFYRTRERIEARGHAASRLDCMSAAIGISSTRSSPWACWNGKAKSIATRARRTSCWTAPNRLTPAGSSKWLTTGFTAFGDRSRKLFVQESSKTRLRAA